jgi:hypothetical protein
MFWLRSSITLWIDPQCQRIGNDRRKLAAPNPRHQQLFLGRPPTLAGRLPASMLDASRDSDRILIT